MYTNLNMNDNNRKLGLGKKEMFKIKKCFKNFELNFPQEFWIKFSLSLKTYVPNICQVFRKVESILVF